MPDSDSLRNIGILAHIDAGKTSLTERLLYVSGHLREPGAVDSGTTATDYLAVERERGITVKAAAARLVWKAGGESLRLNLIDTPGHVDFGGEVERSLRAMDGAVFLLCGVAGVQSRTENLYRACLRRGSPRITFVNKMDRRGASFGRVLSDLRRILDPGAVAIQLPWGEGESFRGVVDLVEMKAYDFLAAGREALQLPGELVAPSLEARARLVESLAQYDESLMEDFVADRESDAGRLRSALRAATMAGRATPALCGSAFADQAAALLLDAIAAYLPSPGESGCPDGVDPVSGALERRRAGPDEPFSALVFKGSNDPRFGFLSWTRVWSGSIKPSSRILDATKGTRVRASRIFGIQAEALEAVESAEAGDIVALALAPAGDAGLTGASLCDPDHPILFESIHFEEPVVSLAVEPRAAADIDTLKTAVEALVTEDPSLRSSVDKQTGRIELSGQGELHLEIAADRLAREWGAHVRVGKPRVELREALAREASAREDFDRDIGAYRARSSVSLGLSPGERGCGLVFRAELASKAPPSLVAAARRGVEAALSVGPTAGYPLEDVVAVLSEMSWQGSAANPSAQAEKAVEIAASIAAGKAAREAGSILLEPFMRLEIETTEANFGSVAAKVTGRGGRIESVEDLPGGGKLVSGVAPLEALFGFAGELRSATAGKAAYSARFSGYEPARMRP
jgi:elongation factor G